MNQRQLTLNSAYGQLIFIVFLPIAILATFGSLLVYQTTKDSIKSEQKALAQALLIRYQPVIEESLPEITHTHENELSANHSLETSYNNPIVDIYHVKNRDHYSIVAINQQLNDIMFSIQTEIDIHRVALIDENAVVRHSAGYATAQPWFETNQPLTKKFIVAKKTSVGTAYGLNIGKVKVNGTTNNLWLFVDMDDKPLQIAIYRIILSLAVIGLLTVLLLLITINIYSRKWIAPLYKLRLRLQSINADNLNQGVDLHSGTEVKALSNDLNQVFHRLDKQFTELKQHAEQTEVDLNTTLDEMEAQNISMRHAQKQAESSNQTKSSFLANISHELRTPLNSIDGFINLLARSESLSAEHQLYIETIRKSSSHLLALVNDVLDFSKIEAGKLVLENHEYDLYAAVYDVVDMLSPLASEKSLRMGVLFYNDVPLTIVGDELRLKQILTNLVANAIKFTDSGDVLVKISLDDNKENFLRIAIQDSGKGVSQQSQQELFNSFNQGDPSITRQYGGTGLGLVISKQITQIMGGTIGYIDNNTVNIAPAGSTFWFDMPTNIQINNAITANEISIPKITRIGHHYFKENDSINVLVWLNHKPSLQLLKACLRPLHIEVTQTNSLASTLEKLKEQGNKWHWVIVDSDTNETRDDMTALLKQIRLHYQGKLSVFGYQVALDTQLLSRYRAFALHEPLDKRQLYTMFDNSADKQNQASQDSLRWQGYRVLAVDDHLPNLLVLEALLAEQGIEVVTASNGFEAIEIISKQSLRQNNEKIDLIFMDIQMPRMSGKETSTEIRNLELDNNTEMQNKRVPIIALTAQGMAEEKESMIAAGIDDYVGKPISQLHLLNVLQRWLPRKTTSMRHAYNTKQANDAINNVGNLVKDTASNNDLWQCSAQNNSHIEDNTELLPSTAFSVVAEQQSLQEDKSGTATNKQQQMINKLPCYIQSYIQSYLQPYNSDHISTTNAFDLSILRSLTYTQIKKDIVDKLHALSSSLYVNTSLYCAINHLVLDEHEIINWQDGLNRSANKSDLASKLISMLIDSLGKEKQCLQDAWRQKNYSLVYQVNHRLLGASRYAGVPQLRHATQLLENEIYFINNNTQINITDIAVYYCLVLTAVDNLINIDLSPWSELRYNRLSEEDMEWKMI